MRQLAAQSYQPEDGDCFSAALHWAMSLDVDDYPNAKLCQGMVHGQGPLKGVVFAHAWGEVAGKIVIDKSNGKNVTMIKEQYYKLGKIDESSVYKYSIKTALALAVKYKHYGPWEFSGDTVRIDEANIANKKQIGKRKLRIPIELVSRLKKEGLQGLQEARTQTFVSGAGPFASGRITGIENPSLNDILGLISKSRTTPKSVRFAVSNDPSPRDRRFIVWDAMQPAIHQELINGESLKGPVVKGMIYWYPKKTKGEYRINFDGHPALSKKYAKDMIQFERFLKREDTSVAYHDM